MKRLGNRHRPYYRLAAIDQRRPRDGRVIEELGTYDPLAKDGEQEVRISVDRCKYWLSVGAQPSETVASLFRKVGLNPASGTKVDDQPTGEQVKSEIRAEPRKKPKAPAPPKAEEPAAPAETEAPAEAEAAAATVAVEASAEAAAPAEPEAAAPVEAEAPAPAEATEETPAAEAAPEAVAEAPAEEAPAEETPAEDAPAEPDASDQEIKPA